MIRQVPLVVLITAVFVSGGVGQQPESSGPVARKPAKTPGLFEAHFMDDSTLKLTVLDDHIELQTPYGKLVIPAADVRRIDFGLRISPEEARRIDTAIADLGNAEFKRRKAASDALLALREKAYPALVRASKGTDAEAVRRAEELLAKLREEVPARRLEVPDHDVLQTADSKIAGRVVTATLHVRTSQFGEQQLKVADVRSLGAPGATAAAAERALPDPGNLGAFQNQVGKTLAFTVTGAPAGSGGVWGTDVYTVDSTLAVAAVHAGVLRPGQTGVVRVILQGLVPAFQDSTRNGVASGSYGAYAGYKIVR